MTEVTSAVEATSTGTEVTADAVETPAQETTQGAPDVDGGQELSFAAKLKRASKKGAADAEAPKSTEPVYEPNFKFSVKGKELEFDDWAKSAIKSKDVEEKVRDFYTKAYGIDEIKQSREATLAELTELKNSKQAVDTALTELGQYKASKDWDSFFDALDIPKQDILKYAVELVQRDQWSPEQKAQWQQSRDAQLAARQGSLEVEQLRSERAQLLTERRSFELDQYLGQPEVTEIAQSYDTGTGNPGAFRRFVIQIGQSHAAQGYDIPVAEAVGEALKHLRAVMPQQMQQSQQSVAPKVATPHQKPVIPSIAGRGTSPIKSTPKSFADLQQRRRELEAMEGI